MTAPVAVPTAPITDLDGPRHYPYPPTGELFPSVTTVIAGTTGKPWLSPWSARLSAAWVLDNLHLREGRTDEEFLALAADEARRLREIKADIGKYCHKVIEALVLWHAGPALPGEIPLPSIPKHLAGKRVDDELPIEDFAEMCLDGFLAFVSDHDPEFILAETTVYNPALGTAGTLDAVLHLPKLDLTPCVDVKTGRDLTGAPEQITGYRDSPEYDAGNGQIEAMPPTDASAVLQLRPEFPRGYRLLLLSEEEDLAARNRFRRAATLFNERAGAQSRPGRVTYPPLPDGTQPPALLADLHGEGYGRIITPLVRALGPTVTVADVAAFTADDLLAVRGIGPKAIASISRLLAEHNLTLTERTEAA